MTGPGAGTRTAILVLAALAASGGIEGAGSQSTLERTPSLDGPWTGRPGIVYFHFLHRFRVTDGPVRKVLNSPTFLLATRVPGGILVGSRYATNSVLVGGKPNEWEVFGRWEPLQQAAGRPVDLGFQLSRNGTAESVDGEVLLGWNGGPLRLLAGLRGFSSYADGEGEVGAVGGAVLRLRPHVAVAGDVGSLFTADGAEAGWSIGLQLEIPYTPHSLSIHLGNANTTTLQGSSTGAGDPRWGFEFTIPVRLDRYFGSRAPDDPQQTRPGAGGTTAQATVEMDNRLQYLPDTVRVPVGAKVRWRNASDLVHTVTADPGKALRPESVRLPDAAVPFDSGNLLPGEEFTHTFTVPGEYRYFCIPHEVVGMVGVVIVTEGRRGGG